MKRKTETPRLLQLLAMLVALLAAAAQEVLPGIPDGCLQELLDLVACFGTNAAECGPCVPEEGGLLEFLAFLSPPENPIDCIDLEDPICPVSACCVPCRDVLLGLYMCRLMEREDDDGAGDAGNSTMTVEMIEECFPLDCPEAESAN